jgi:hypothetical protein
VENAGILRPGSRPCQALMREQHTYKG